MSRASPETVNQDGSVSACMEPPQPGSSLADIRPSFETFTPFKCLTAAEHLITILCLKSSVDVRRFYALVHKKLHHHTLFHTRTNTPIGNRTHLPLSTACSTVTLASLFIPVKLKVLVQLERPMYFLLFQNLTSL
jgi:hypothetical protein